MSYLPAVQQFPLSGAALAQGIYDPKRDLYYFTDAAQVRVFSKTQGEWLSPMNVLTPAVNHRLWGIALSPDGSKLAVSDPEADLVYLINPDSPGSAQTFTLGDTSAGPYVNPTGVAISDSGIIYVTVENNFNADLAVDTTTGGVTALSVPAYNGPFARAVISSDNARVYFNNCGTVFVVDTATGNFIQSADGPGTCYGDYDLTLSSGQTAVEATSYLFDADLNGESYLTLKYREALNMTYVYGAKLSRDGTLLFQPSLNGIDVFDGRLGTLRTRIALPFALSENYDTLVSDGHDNVLIAITGATGSGIAVVDLTWLTEPPPLTYGDRPAYRSRVSGWKLHHAVDSASSNGMSGNPVQPNLPGTVIRHVTNGGVERRR